MTDIRGPMSERAKLKAGSRQLEAASELRQSGGAGLVAQDQGEEMSGRAHRDSITPESRPDQPDRSRRFFELTVRGQRPSSTLLSRCLSAQQTPGLRLSGSGLLCDVSAHVERIQPTAP